MRGAAGSPSMSKIGLAGVSGEWYIEELREQEVAMPRFLVCHTVPGITREALEQLSQAAQEDPEVRGISSWSNLTTGVVHCVFEAPSADVLASWFEKMDVPYDRITTVEVEGEGGTLRDVTEHVTA